MKNSEVIDLFNKDELLVRAMHSHKFNNLNNEGEFGYDFSNWAREINLAETTGLSSLSTTLLVSGEKIPTYDSYGFIINSNKAEIQHVADLDSGSSGSFEKGDFNANETDLYTLADLATKTRKEHLTDMNEVNVKIKKDAYVGLFTVINNDEEKMNILLAQQHYKQQTGDELPIFHYNTSKGTITSLDMSEDEKNTFIKKMLDEKILQSSKIHYGLQVNEEYQIKSFDIIDLKENENQRKKQPSTKDKLMALSGRGSLGVKPPYKPQEKSKNIDTSSLTLDAVTYKKMQEAKRPR